MSVPRLKRWAKSWWIELNELAGSDRYAQPARGRLGAVLAKHLKSTPGIFVEAGANDGYTQSNTYFLETRRGWRGLLIEPVPELFRKCRRRRRRSTVVHAALVPSDFEGTSVRIAVAGLMSATEGAFDDAAIRETHLERAQQVLPEGPIREVEVPAATLGFLMDRHLGGERPDLISLDVEGWELQALRGLDLPRQAAEWLLVETRANDGVAAFLEPCYELVEVADDLGTYRDLLFRRRG